MRLVRISLAIVVSLLLMASVCPSVQADEEGGEVDLTAEVITYQITDLSASNPTQNSIDLTWTTPAVEVRPFSYFDVRYSTTTITTDNWDEATRATGEPTPVAGASQGMKVRGVDSDTKYYFAMKLVDEEGFVGPLSNIASATTLAAAPVDEIPPAQITDLAATAGSPATTKVILSWTAPGDDADIGTATSYEIRRSNSEITDANWTLATLIYNNIIPQAAGGSESFMVSRLTLNTTYYFAIQARDEADNTSPTSNSPSITTAINLPTVTSISPTSGDNSQATIVTINGTNFVVGGGTNVVRFVSDDNTFDLTSVSCGISTQLTAVVAKGAPTGIYRARVINENGTSELSSATYEVAEAPTPLPVVTNLIPQMVASDTSVSGVQIFGESLTGTTTVSFGDTVVTSFTVVSDTKITADVPGLSAGEYDVKVTTPAGTNEVSAVKFVVSDPVVINEDTTEDITTSEVVKLETNVVPVQLTLTTDKAETATKATDVDVDIEVVIPPQTTVTSEGEAYIGNINPPRVVKPDESVLTDLADNAVVIEMGNPEKTINFDQDLVLTVTITTSVEPVIWYYNKDTKAYELAGKTGTKDGIDYVPGGTKLGQEDSTYTMGLLLDHMSSYIAGVKPHITSAPAAVTAGQNITITGANFHPTAAKVYLNGATGTIVSRTSTTRIVVTFPTPGSYTLKVENPDKLSDTRDITLEAPAPPLPGVGVGVGPAPPPPLPPGTTDVRGMVSTEGVFSWSVTIRSEDGLCRLTIPEGTVGLTEKLEPLTEITMLIMDEPPPPPEGTDVIGLVYDFQPSGATFEPPITLTFTYDEALIPEGVTEESLVITVWDEEAGKWFELDCVVNPGFNIITAEISHFTTFAILAYTRPPAFVASDLSITPAEVDIGEEVTISVLVINTGDLAGSYEVTVNIDEVVVASEEVTLAGGASEMVTFTTAKDVAGTYAVTIDGLSGKFVVRIVPAIVVNWPVVGGIIAAVVVAGLVIFFLIRRRAH